ncbi:MAG: glycosyltransferase family 2 protein [Streptococcaceae bacterium]|nr:glycosyltransferase family 2 protein [Streptococcaceae bacterium]
MKVNILLSAYNGEKYIAEQIESLQSQTFSDWNLIVRDDGSRDKTAEIVEQFHEQDARIRLIKGENIGVIQSFFELVKTEEADFYFFCDQDDVWLENKLEIMLTEAKNHDNSKSVLYYSDLKVVDKDLNILNESMIRSQSHHANTELIQELTENTVTGCTSLINHALAQEWTDTDGIIMHDWWLALLASAIGELVYLDQATVLYRQHGDNVLGARTLSKRMGTWFHPQVWLAKYWWLITSSQAQAKKLLTLPDLSEGNKDLVSSYCTLLEKSVNQRKVILKKYNFKKNRSLHTRIFRFLIMSKLAYKENR